MQFQYQNEFEHLEDVTQLKVTELHVDRTHSEWGLSDRMFNASEVRSHLQL